MKKYEKLSKNVKNCQILAKFQNSQKSPKMPKSPQNFSFLPKNTANPLQLTQFYT